MIYYINELKKMICHFFPGFSGLGIICPGWRCSTVPMPPAGRMTASLEGKDHKVVPYEPTEAGPGDRDAARYGRQVAAATDRGQWPVAAGGASWA